MPCSGITSDHCCYVEGEVCPHLRDDGVQADRRWVCTLREELGSWEAVHQDSRYKVHPQPVWQKLNIDECGDYPSPGITCGECGQTG